MGAFRRRPHRAVGVSLPSTTTVSAGDAQDFTPAYNRGDASVASARPGATPRIRLGVVIHVRNAQWTPGGGQPEDRRPSVGGSGPAGAERRAAYSDGVGACHVKRLAGRRHPSHDRRQQRCAGPTGRHGRPRPSSPPAAEPSRADLSTHLPRRGRTEATPRAAARDRR